MPQNYPFSIPTGIDLIPRGSGSSSLGSSDFPFGTIYVQNIISSGGAGEYVNVTGDTMTGNLTMSGSTSIIMNPVRIGSSIVDSGVQSVAIGKNNTIYGGLQPNAIGGQNLASGLVATAIGYGNQAFKNFSSSVGTNNIANGDSASAFGRQNQALADNASAFGNQNIANGVGTIVVGKQVTGNLDETLYLGAPSGVEIVYDNVDNTSSARIKIADLSANASSLLEMTGNVVRLSYDEGVSNGFGHIEFNGDGLTTIKGGQSAGFSQLELGPAQFSFLAPSAGGLEANFSGVGGILGFNTSSFVGNKNANISINQGQSIKFDFVDNVSPFYGNVDISSTGVVLSGIDIYPYVGGTQKLGDYQPFSSINIPFDTVAANNIFTNTIEGMDSVTIRSHPTLSAAVGSTQYTVGAIDSHAIDASNFVVLHSHLDSSSALWSTSLTTPGGGSSISGATSSLQMAMSGPGGNSVITLSPYTITLGASGPGQPVVLPSQSGIDIGSAGMHFGTIYVDNVVSTGISAGSFVATSGGTMTGDLTMSGSSILANSTGTSSLGSNAIPFSGVFTSRLNNKIIVTSVYNEVPSGLINGSNTIYSLLFAPYGNSLQLFKNGFYMSISGLGIATTDCVLSGSTITFVTAPASGSSLVCNYNYAS